jgi:hypothetical protein
MPDAGGTVSLVLLWLVAVVVLFALFWGGGLVAQGVWYQEVADYFPLRAGGAAVLVGSYLTLWVALDRHAPGRYDTLFEFASEERVPFEEFEAIRWISTEPPKLKMDESGQPVEVVTLYRKTGRESAFTAVGSGESFRLNGTQPGGEAFMTVALRVRLDPQGEPIRFNAALHEERPGVFSYASGLEGRRFLEVGGNRYIFADQIGTVYVPTPKVVVVSLLLNFLLFVIWFIALWPILQFQPGHAAGLTLAFGFATMLIVLPLLFQPNRQPPPAPPPAAVALSYPLSSAPELTRCSMA